MKVGPGKIEDGNCRAHRNILLSFSIRHHNFARYLFIILTFAGLISTGWYGIPLAPRYFVSNSTDIVAGIFTILSALGAIWGIMAYREFTRSLERVIEARLAARRLDPTIGEYEYRSYNPITRKYDEGFVPSGPIDFWDKETQVPAWMDKGKYWHVVMSLEAGGKEVRLQVVKDSDLPFDAGPRNAAVTTTERADSSSKSQQTYFVKIPQWLVMNTERGRFAGKGLAAEELSALISDANRRIVEASDEVAYWERLRLRYPWKPMTLWIYLNKSLPLRIVYGELVRKFPGAKGRALDETNLMLANVKDDQLVKSLLELAKERGISQNRMEMLELLIRFLRNSYAKLGLGEGASEYHSFHHSLEVSYMALYMLPRQIDRFAFGPKDYEIMLVASLLHDYDPAQAKGTEKTVMKGPSVVRTIGELEKSRVLDAYFTMNSEEFANYFREYKSAFSPPTDYATTHPEYVKIASSPIDSTMAQALIWRTDFPFSKQKLANEMFDKLLTQLTSSGIDAQRVSLIAETLWLADLAVTYMGSDPIRAWDRVTNLYDELSLPKPEVMLRTDAFFSDFSENELFRRIINTRNFPGIFRHRWNMIYRFFHEGNPSTQINRTVASARKMYSSVNMEIGMRRGDMLRTIAVGNWSGYFIGIGRDQNEVLRAKSIFAELDPQNASAFWGNTDTLLPSIHDGSIDNFLLVLPERSADSVMSSSFGVMLKVITTKLVRGGTLQILTDMRSQSSAFEELMKVAADASLERVPNTAKVYFPESWQDPDFKSDRTPLAIVLALKQ